MNLKYFFALHKKSIVLFVGLLIVGLSIPLTTWYLRSRQTLDSGASPITCQVPIDFIFVIDLSNSMTTNDVGMTRIQAVKNSLKAFFDHPDIAQSGSVHRFSFVTYNDDARIISDFSTDMVSAKTIINDLGSSKYPHKSGTRIDLGVVKALEQVQKPLRSVTIKDKVYNAKRAVVLLTDGAQSDALDATGKILKTAATLKIDVELTASQIRKSAYLATLGFGVDPASLDLALLERIATPSPKLLYTHAKTNSELTNFFTNTIKGLVDCSCSYASTIEIIGEDGKVLTVPGFKTTSTVGGVKNAEDEVFSNGLAKESFVTDNLPDTLRDKLADVNLSFIPAGWQFVSSNCVENVSVAGVKTCGTPDPSNQKLLKDFKFVCGANISYQYRVKKVASCIASEKIFVREKGSTVPIQGVSGFGVERIVNGASDGLQLISTGTSAELTINHSASPKIPYNMVVSQSGKANEYKIVGNFCNGSDCATNVTPSGSGESLKTLSNFKLGCFGNLTYGWEVERIITDAVCLESTGQCVDKSRYASLGGTLPIPASCDLANVGTTNGCKISVCENTTCTTINKGQENGRQICDPNDRNACFKPRLICDLVTNACRNSNPGESFDPSLTCNNATTSASSECFRQVCKSEACVKVSKGSNDFNNPDLKVCTQASDCSKPYTFCEDTVCKRGTYTGATPPANAVACREGSDLGNGCSRQVCVAEVCKRVSKGSAEFDDPSLKSCTQLTDCAKPTYTYCEDTVCKRGTYTGATPPANAVACREGADLGNGCSRQVCVEDICKRVVKGSTEFDNPNLKSCTQTTDCPKPTYTYCENEVCRLGTYDGLTTPPNSADCDIVSNLGCKKQSYCENFACIESVCLKGSNPSSCVKNCKDNPSCQKKGKKCIDYTCVEVFGDKVECTSDEICRKIPPVAGVDNNTLMAAALGILVVIIGVFAIL